MPLEYVVTSLLPHFHSFTTVLVRIAGIVAAIPILGSRNIPIQVKTGLIVTLGLIVSPLVSLQTALDSPVLLVGGVAAEFLIGMVIGLAVRLLFAALEVAGEIVGTQMGFAVVQLLDPTTQQQAPLVGQYFLIITSLVFLMLNAHVVVIRTIVTSYELIPPFGAALPAYLAHDVLRLSQNALLIALKLSAPMVGVILIVNVTLALLGRAVAQMNVFVMSFPITIVMGLFIMGLALPYSVSLMEAETETVIDTILSLLYGLGHG